MTHYYQLSCLWAGLGLLALQVAADLSTCRCTGIDYSNGGSYLVDGSSDDKFTFTSVFESESNGPVLFLTATVLTPYMSSQPAANRTPLPLFSWIQTASSTHVHLLAWNKMAWSKCLAGQLVFIVVLSLLPHVDSVITDGLSTSVKSPTPTCTMATT